VYMTLKKGDRLPTVALAQARLVEAGAPNLRVDGLFGPKTEAAVTNFQAQMNVPRTGKVDQATWGAITQLQPLKDIVAMDGSSTSLLIEDRPFYDDGQSNIMISYGMSYGASVFIDRLVAENAPGSVALLRFDGHGGPGQQRIAGGGKGINGTSEFNWGHFKKWPALSRAWFSKIGSVMKPYGSIELHGCRIAYGAHGAALLTGLADACGVPVSAGVILQDMGRPSDRFQGPTVTHCPKGVPLRAWASKTFTSCQW
jgi:Putative peptidoglycan binding domain